MTLRLILTSVLSIGCGLLEHTDYKSTGLFCVVVAAIYLIKLPFLGD